MERNKKNFDTFMFGKRNYEKEFEKEPENKEDFNLLSTAETIMETYEQLSPYLKQAGKYAKGFFKK